MAGFTINGDTLRVYCVDEHRQVVELAYDRAWGSGNIGADLKAPAVSPSSPLVGFAVNGPNSRVYNLDDNLDIIELYWTGRWNSKNVTSEAKVPRAMAGTTLAGFAMRTDHWCVYYIDDRNDIFELAWTGQAWQATNLTGAAKAPAVRTGSALVAYPLNGNAARVYYANNSGQVIELAGKDGVWSAGSIPRRS